MYLLRANRGRRVSRQENEAAADRFSASHGNRDLSQVMWFAPAEKNALFIQWSKCKGSLKKKSESFVARIRISFLSRDLILLARPS